MLPSAPSSQKDPNPPTPARVGKGQLSWGRLPQPYKRPHSGSILHQATLKMLPPAQIVGQQQTGSSKRTRLHEAFHTWGFSYMGLVQKEVVVVVVEGVFSRLPEAVYPSRRS